MKLNMFLDEAYTQGTILEDNFNYYFENKNTVFSKLKSEFEEKECNQIILTGIGSSLYACYALANYSLAHDVPTYVYNSFELFTNKVNLITEKTLLILVSQSGNSWELKELLDLIPKNTLTVGLHNNEEGMLKQRVKHELKLRTGKETCITNKTYQSTILILNMLLHYLFDELNEEFAKDMKEVIKFNHEWLDNQVVKTKVLYDFLSTYHLIDFIADGASLSTAGQSSLIFREGPRQNTNYMEFSDYAHGYYLNAKENYVAIAILHTVKADKAPHNRMIKYITDNKGKVLLLTTNINELNTEDKNLKVVLLPKVRESLVPLSEIIVTDTIMGFYLGIGWSR